ncbi:MAG: MGMT family protein [Chlorobi bacterium]|nr:MGMT family protein [Chlorobiota bacterium]
MSQDNFFEKVYRIARAIPYGRVTSYGAIAGAVGSPGAARMVGWAMNKAYEQEEYVPAHRVVNSKGLLTGKMHFPGENTMQELLENEGVVVVNDQIQNFNEVFWEPDVEFFSD